MKLTIIILFFLPLFCRAQTVSDNPLSLPDSMQLDLIYKWINSIELKDIEEVKQDTFPLPYTILNSSDSNLQKGKFIPDAFLDSVRQIEDSLTDKIYYWKITAKTYEATAELYQQIYEEMEKQLEAEQRKNELSITQ